MSEPEEEPGPQSDLLNELRADLTIYLGEASRTVRSKAAEDIPVGKSI